MKILTKKKVTLILDKAEFRIKKIIRDKEEYYIITKRSFFKKI